MLWKPLCSLTATLLLGACADTVSPAKDAPSSVILISIDTLRADHVGTYGYERETTPFLDRWAEGSTVFERAYSTAAWTLVAHMTMLTGLFPEQHDVLGQYRALSPEIPLLAERLRDAGYRTAGLYFPGWIHERHGFERGFDLFLPHKSLEEADLHLDQLMGELGGQNPFFLFLHLFDVHCGPFSETGRSIYPAPAPYERMFVEQDMRPWPDVPASEVWWTRDQLGPADFETATAFYDGGIRQVDDQLALWFEEFERSGLLANTMIIVTSDHGEALGQRGILDKHGEYFEEGLHIPLIVRHPKGRGAGTRVKEPVHLADLLPTILEVAKLPVEVRLPGLPLFGDLPSERLIYGVKFPEAFILRGKEKYVLGPNDSCLLLDLDADPAELAPVKVDPERFQELRKEVMSRGGTFPPHVRIDAISPEDQADLEALGYGGVGEKSVPPEKQK